MASNTPTPPVARPLPSRGQLVLPILEELLRMGGEARSADVIDAVSARMGVPDDVKNAFEEIDRGPRWGKGRRSRWRQTVHWGRHSAISLGLLVEKNRKYGYWTLSDKGRATAWRAEKGVVVTVYTTPSGRVLWADAATASGILDARSVSLVHCSPGYPQPGKGRAYGNLTPAETVELIVRCGHLWKRALKDDGSVVLNLRDVFLPKAETGGAVRSLYQEKILLALVEEVGLYLAEKFIWRNPSCMGDRWVTIEHVRCTSNFENVYWFSKTPNPKADNRRVLVDPAPSTIATYLRKAKTGQRNVVGPGGHNNVFEEQIAAVAAGQSIKVVPRTVLDFANTDPKKRLHAVLDELGLPHHDATQAPALANFMIRFLTEPGDTVFDPFYGSGTTGQEAQKLGRPFIGSDYLLNHVLGSAVRFPADTLRYEFAA